MGTIVSFKRVSDAQLAKIIADPDNYWEVVDDPDSAETDGYLDKAWSDLSELLMSSGTQIDLGADGELIDGSEDLFSWSPALVQRTAEKLRDTPFATLAAHYENEPVDEDDLDYLHEYYEVLVKFFGSAAAAGTAAVMSMG
ncbi:DUF1877 family protein [Nocardia sp. CA-290969]|uniref:DUF1877 family protein n=1 Tax=Nocardia sp. CA-290969 TaxID=3239986 RepID=UPI003D8F3B11